MLKGIIFDMDGVLINSEPFHYRVWKETLKERGIDLDYEVYKGCIGSTIGVLMQILHDRYGISLEDTSLRQEMSEKKAELIRKKVIRPLIPYVKEFLEKLYQGGYKLAVASFLAPFLY